MQAADSAPLAPPACAKHRWVTFPYMDTSMSICVRNIVGISVDKDGKTISMWTAAVALGRVFISFDTPEEAKQLFDEVVH